MITCINYRENNNDSILIDKINKIESVIAAGNFSVHLVGEKTHSYFLSDDNNLCIYGYTDLHDLAELSNILKVDNGYDLLLIAEAYKKWGSNCTRYLEGNYAFVVCDKQEQQVFCARDPLGQVPLYYNNTGGQFLISTNFKELSEFCYNGAYDDDWIVDYLMGNSSYKDKTPLMDIKRLLPGHTYTINHHGSSLKQYWTLADTVDSNIRNEDDAVEGLKSHLQYAVKTALGKTMCAGIELSGGLDSSAVAVFARQSLAEKNGNLIAFANVLPAEYRNHYSNFIDERKKSSQVADSLNISKYLVSDKLLHDHEELIAKTLDLIGYPVNSSLTVYQQNIFTMAANEGVSTLLTGFGGDEMISGKVIEQYIYSLMSNHKILECIRFFRKHDIGYPRAIATAAYKYYRYMSPTSRNPKFNDLLEKRWEGMILVPRLLNDSNTKAHFLSYPFYKRHKSIREKSISDVNSPGRTARIEDGFNITRQYGIRYAHPLFNVKLLEFYYSLPDVLKITDLNGRGLLRKALKDYLPLEIVNQKKPLNTYSAPFCRPLLDSNFERLKNYCLSLDNNNKIFMYISKARISALSHSGSNESYFSFNLLERAMMLDLFFRKWK